MSANKESWGSRVGLILAMAGNAVGLGNFLRFPVQAVQNGGGAFIIPYLICFLVMGIPLLWIEWSMGRFGGKFGHHSTPFIVDTMGKNRLWKYIGVFGIWTNIAVAAYYCYIESWTLSYVFHSIVGTFSGMDQAAVAGFFGEYVSLGTSTLGIPYEPIVFYVICLLLNTWILSQGLASGVERVAKIGMPMLIIFGLFLAFKGVTITAGENGAINDSSVGLNFLWTPNFDRLWSPTVWLAAAGQIFFTLSVGMGTVHCYASYVRSKDDIALNAMSAGWMNEFVEVVLGGAILQETNPRGTHGQRGSDTGKEQQAKPHHTRQGTQHISPLVKQVRQRPESKTQTTALHQLCYAVNTQVANGNRNQDSTAQHHFHKLVHPTS